MKDINLDVWSDIERSLTGLKDEQLTSIILLEIPRGELRKMFNLVIAEDMETIEDRVYRMVVVNKVGIIRRIMEKIPLHPLITTIDKIEKSKYPQYEVGP